MTMSAPVVDRALLLGLQPADDGWDGRAQALAQLAMQSLPTVRDEEYKYTPLNRLGDVPWSASSALAIDRAIIQNQFLSEVDQHSIVFVNGRFARGLSNVDGLKFSTLDESKPKELGTLALSRQVDFPVSAHLGRLNKPAMPLTAALNTACFQDGIYLEVLSKLEKPVHVVHINVGEQNVSTPRNLIVVGTGAELNLIETYLSDSETLSLPVTEVIVHSGAVMEHVRLGNEGISAKHISLTEVYQHDQSTYRSTNICFGGALTRNDINIFVAGENAHTRFDGVVALDGEQHADNHTRLDHAQPNCESFEVYKHLLSGKSRAVFNGKIFVHQDAQKTDAKQTNMTLLLSQDAQIDTKPQLEIFADDVKCTHGATIGQIRQEALFYLKSRGIDDATAKGLLVYAFAAEVLELVQNRALRAALEQMLIAKLGSN